MAEAVKPQQEQVWVYHAPSEPFVMLSIPPNIVQLHEESIGGTFYVKKGQPPGITVKFQNGRFTTKDARLAKIIDYCIDTWPRHYGRIIKGHTDVSRVSNRINELRAKTAAAGLGNILGDTASEGRLSILDNAEQTLRAGDVRLAESLVNAATQSWAATTSTMVVDDEAAEAIAAVSSGETFTPPDDSDLLSNLNSMDDEDEVSVPMAEVTSSATGSGNPFARAGA